MNQARIDRQLGTVTGFGRTAGQMLFQSASTLLLHPIGVLGVLVFLLGGTPGQIAWYAVVAGLANGLAAPIGTVLARWPALTRYTAAGLFAVQAVGFAILAVGALRGDGLSDASAIRTVATAYILLVVPGAAIQRIVEQSREYARQQVPIGFAGLVAALAIAFAGLGVWRLAGTEAIETTDLLGRIALPGALALLAAGWLGIAPILGSTQWPWPARTLPPVEAPRLVSNTPLLRYGLFQALNGLSRFADVFVLIAIGTAVIPSREWIGGAILAFALGDALARLALLRLPALADPQTAIVGGIGFRVAAILVAAFLPAMSAASLIAERGQAATGQRWALVAAAALLGAGYRLAHRGNADYIQSITPPPTREVTRAVVGVVMVVTAFTPLVAVRLLDGGMSLEVLMRWAAGGAALTLLLSPLIVRPFVAPTRRGGAWSLRRRA